MSVYTQKGKTITPTIITTASRTTIPTKNLDSVLVLYNDVDASVINTNGTFFEPSWNIQGDVYSE